MKVIDKRPPMTIEINPLYNVKYYIIQLFDINFKAINGPEITGKSLVFVYLALQSTIVMKNAMHTIIKKTVLSWRFYMTTCSNSSNLHYITFHGVFWGGFFSISCSQVCLMYDMQIVDQNFDMYRFF